MESNIYMELTVEELEGFEMLVDLNLNDFRISKLEENVFGEMVNLESISMKRNGIREIDNNLFGSNSNLRKINLSFNFLTSIDRLAFVHLDLLQNLDLSNNKIKVVCDHCLVQINLKHLDLSYNEIETIEDNAFGSVTNLRFLNLSGNRLKSLNNSMFVAWQHLKCLLLSSNSLTQIPVYENRQKINGIDVDRFNNNYLKKLRVLDLSNNEIDFLKFETFVDAYLLKTLKIHVTERWESSVLRPLKKLNHLHVRCTASISLRWKGNLNFWNLCISKCLTTLELVCNYLDPIRNENFAHFQSLVSFEVECLNKQPLQCKIKFKKNFHPMPKLAKLKIKNLNDFRILPFKAKPDLCFDSLKYLELSANKDAKFLNKTEKNRQPGQLARASGRDTDPPAIRCWVPPSIKNRHNVIIKDSNDIVFRKVRGILNKLTPDNFDKLTHELVCLEINTIDRLKGLAFLTLQKAADEPKYSYLYAQLCKRLDEKLPNFNPPEQPSTFRNLLANTCENEFNNRSQKIELDREVFDEKEQKTRAKQRMLGNFKFIGELGRLEIVREAVLFDCIKLLLKEASRSSIPIEERCENLECMCQLLRICGRRLDADKGQWLMNQVFAQIEKLTNVKNFPQRIRFMLMDMIELRSNNWIARLVEASSSKTVKDKIDQNELTRSHFNNNSRAAAQNRFGIFHSSSSSSSSSSYNANYLPSYQNSCDYYHETSDRFRNSSNAKLHYVNGNGGSGSGSVGGSCGSGGGGGGSCNINSQHRYSSNMGSANANAINNSTGYGHNNNCISGSGPNYSNHQNNSRSYDNKINNHSNNYQRNFQRNNHLNNYGQVKSTGELAPRFKKNLLIASQGNMNDLELRPSADSMLFNRVHFKQQSNHHVTIDNSAILMMDNLNLNLNRKSEQDTPLPPIIVPPIPIAAVANQTVSSKVQKSEKGGGKHKKEKSLSKHEVLEKVQKMMEDFFANKMDETDAIECLRLLKIPEKFKKDAILGCLVAATVACPSRDSEQRQKFTLLLKLFHKQSLFNKPAFSDAFEQFCSYSPHKDRDKNADFNDSVANLVAHGIVEDLVSLKTIADAHISGKQYPLFLHVLCELEKLFGCQQKTKIAFQAIKLDLLQFLPASNRSREALLKILQEYKLTYLQPLLEIQSSMQKQLALQPKPEFFLQWIKQNIQSHFYGERDFVYLTVSILLQFITQECESSEEKTWIYLKSFKEVFKYLLENDVELQTVALYSVQEFFYLRKKAKGSLLKWFTMLYDLEIVTNDAYLTWRDDINDSYQGKGNALFEVTNWLTNCLQFSSAESDDADYAVLATPMSTTTATVATSATPTTSTAAVSANNS